MHNYHTIVTDLDGTLLNNQSEISEYNQNVLNQVMKSGMNLILATGRRYFSTSKYALKFPWEIYIVCNNGQIIRKSPTGARIREHYIDQKTIQEIVFLGRKNGYFPVMHVDEYENGLDIISEMPKDNKLFLDYVGNKRDRSMEISDVLSRDISRVTVICFFANDIEKLRNFEKEISKNQSCSSVRCIITTIHKFGPCMEIVCKNVSKWSAVLEILQIQNLDPKGVISFGDEENDLEMIEFAGLGVAMKNAVPSLKKKAKQISKFDNDQDGVGRCIEEIGVI